MLVNSTQKNNEFSQINHSLGDLSALPRETMIHVLSYLSSHEAALNQRINQCWREYGLAMIQAREEELRESYKIVCNSYQIDPLEGHFPLPLSERYSLETHAYSLNYIKGQILKGLLHYLVTKQDREIELAETHPIPALLQPIIPRIFSDLRLLKAMGDDLPNVRAFYTNLFREKRYEEAMSVVSIYLNAPEDQTRRIAMMLCCANNLYSETPRRSFQLLLSIPEDLEGTVLQKNYILGNFVMEYFAQGQFKEGMKVLRHISGSLYQSLYLLDLIFLILDDNDTLVAEDLLHKIPHPRIKEWAEESYSNLCLQLDNALKEFLGWEYFNLYGNENRKLRYPKRTFKEPDFDHADVEITRLKGNEEASISSHTCPNVNCILSLNNDRSLHLYTFRSEIIGNHTLTLKAALKVKNPHRQNALLMKLFLRAKTRQEYNRHLFHYVPSNSLVEKISRAITGIHFSIGGSVISLGNVFSTTYRVENFRITNDEFQRLR